MIWLLAVAVEAVTAGAAAVEAVTTGAVVVEIGAVAAVVTAAGTGGTDHAYCVLRNSKALTQYAVGSRQ